MLCKCFYFVFLCVSLCRVISNYHLIYSLFSRVGLLVGSFIFLLFSTSLSAGTAGLWMGLCCGHRCFLRFSQDYVLPMCHSECTGQLFARAGRVGRPTGVEAETGRCPLRSGSRCWELRGWARRPLWSAFFTMTIVMWQCPVRHGGCISLPQCSMVMCMTFRSQIIQPSAAFLAALCRYGNIPQHCTGV